MKSASDYREMARNMLRGFWVITAAITLLASVLGGISGGGGSVSSNSEEVFDLEEIEQILPQEENRIVVEAVQTFQSVGVKILAVVGIFLAIYSIVLLVIGGAVGLGLNQVYIRLAYGDAPTVKTLFSRMSYIGKAFRLRLVMGLFIMLWTFLFIIPGIIATYRYALAPYLMSENPDMGVMKAIRESKELMIGNKFRLFCLELSFIGWSLLSVLTCGIGFLVLNPYILAAKAAFYLDIAREEGYDNRSVVE